MTPESLPRHIAVIMDGNGRWAKARGLPRTAGHRQGVVRVRQIVKAARELGIKVLTLFAFSTENWKRPKREVDALMRELDNFLRREANDLMRNNIRLMVIGKKGDLSVRLQERLDTVMRATEHNQGLILNIALSYGGRAEIVEASRRIVQDVLGGKLGLGEVDEEVFSQYLDTAGLPDPDLLIRTSGEQRVSNFLLWQLSYAEFYFTEKHWPDFTREDLLDAIEEYARRERRFGRVSAVREENKGLHVS